MRMFWFLLALIIGALAGWRYAHGSIAAECERLGGFFVGKTVFHCSEVRDHD